MTTIDVQLPAYHPAQQLVADDTARFKVLMCGRRWGKSMFCYSEIADAALDGQPAALFGPNYKYASDGWRWFKEHLDPIIRWKSEQEMRLELITGGIIDVWSLDKPDAGRGRKYKLIGVDEGGIVRNLLDCWNRAIRPTLADLKGGAIIEGTPSAAGDLALLFDRGQGDSTKWKSWRFRTVDNPYIAASEVEEARSELPTNIFMQEFEGVPDDDGGNPFGLKAIAEIIGDRSEEPTAVFGIDLAKSEDWTVIVGLDRHGRWTFFDRFQKRPWNEIEDRIAEAVGSVPALVDSTGVGDPIVEGLQRRCPYVEGFKFSATSKQQIMEGLMKAVQKRDIVVPDGDCAAELRTFRYEYTKNGVRYEAPPGFHDDCVCALALAVQALGTRQHISPVFVSKPASDRRLESFLMGNGDRSRSPFGR